MYRLTIAHRLRISVMLLLISFPINLYAQTKFVYLNDDFDAGSGIENTVSGLSVMENGTLILIPGSPFPTAGLGSGGGFFAANRITSCSMGNFLYASNDGSGTVSGFSIDPSAGVLTRVPGSPFPVPGGTGTSENLPSGDISLACTPDSRFVIAANGFANLITVFRITANGALAPTEASPFSMIAPPDGIKISSDNKFLAVAEFSINSIEMFNIGPDGALTPVPGSPFHASGSGNVAGVDINCAGNLLFAAKANNGNTIVDVFGISPNGALTLIPGSPFVAGVGDNSNVVLLSADDKFLFVSNQDSQSVTVFTVGVDGNLTLVPGSPFPAPASFDPTGMATDPSGKFLYVADSVQVYVYDVGTAGTLTLVPGSPFSKGRGTGLSLTAFPGKTCGIQVSTIAVDIKPGSGENTVNPKSKGVIPVAILSTNSFDASTVDQASLRFGPGQALAQGRGHFEDVNGDGQPDLVLHFRTQDSGIQCGDTSVSITGQTVNGIAIQGSDTVRTVGCKASATKKK